MKTEREIIQDVKAIFTTNWKSRAGTVVPEPDTVQLGNDAVEMDATVLYADMMDSTGLVVGHKSWFAAEVYKAYLVAACHLIRNNGGVITAFDGDRVMAVYNAGNKNTAAAKTALQINWAVIEINKAIKSAYSTSFELRQTVGIDTSSLFVAKTGIRDSNDLVWVGRAANFAAKLAGISDGNYSSFITDSVFNRLRDEAKYGANPKRLMWERSVWKDRNISVYKSNWKWEP